MGRAPTRTTRIPPLRPDEADLFAAARLRAARLQPYLAGALFAMVPVRSPGYGTFGVDRHWRLYVDPDRAREWGVRGTAAVLLHEAHHLVRDHHGRAERIGVTDATARLWNLAGDAAINDDLLVDGIELPMAVLPHHLGCSPHGLEESYFRTIRDRPEPKAPDPTDRVGPEPQEDGQEGPDAECGSGAGGHAHPDEIDEEPASEEEGLDPVGVAVVQRGVAHEVTAADRRGDPVTPAMLRWATSVLEPKVPWTTLLRAVLGKELRACSTHSEPTWTRIDRRGESSPEVLRPGHRRQGPTLAVVIDTSASMDGGLLDAAVAEIDSLVHRAGIRPLTVVVCDESAATPQRIRRLGSLSLAGGRGTDMRVGIGAAASLRPTPRVIVVLTDGLTPWPDRAPAGTSLVAVLIDSTRREQAPQPQGPGIHVVRVGLDDA